jgi:hypothetical protein
MQTSLNLRNFFITAILLLLFSCNSSSSKDKAANNDNPPKDSSAAPPLTATTNPPGVIMKVCFASDGLKYKTVVSMTIEGNAVVGNVTSEELESNKKETTEFAGTIDGNKLTIKFKGTPPVIGASSEWTDKPWNIKKDGGKETLHIIFNAKNYETNKWEDTDYQFVLIDCK